MLEWLFTDCQFVRQQDGLVRKRVDLDLGYDCDDYYEFWQYDKLIWGTSTIETDQLHQKVWACATDLSTIEIYRIQGSIDPLQTLSSELDQYVRLWDQYDGWIVKSQEIIEHVMRQTEKLNEQYERWNEQVHTLKVRQAKDILFDYDQSDET